MENLVVLTILRQSRRDPGIGNSTIPNPGIGNSSSGLQSLGMIVTGVDLAGILGDAWPAPKAGRCRVGWSTGASVPSAADQRVSGGALGAPPAGSGSLPRPETDFSVFWRPQNVPFCTYMTKSGGQFALASPLQILGRNCSPVTPWSTPMMIAECWTRVQEVPRSNLGSAKNDVMHYL